MRASSVDQIILETLAKKHVHLTCNQVYEAICTRLPAVNPSTVYRSLERLAKTGKISVSDMGTGSAVYEALVDGVHHHLVCQKCGQVMTIDEKDVGDFFAMVQQKNQFRVITNHLILFGVCKVCQRSNPEGD